jgi:hypothetical protein
LLDEDNKYTWCSVFLEGLTLILNIIWWLQNLGGDCQ